MVFSETFGVKLPLDSLIQQFFRNTARSCLPGKSRPFSHKCSSKSNIVARNLRAKMPLMRVSLGMRTLARLSRPNVSTKRGLRKR